MRATTDSPEAPALINALADLPAAARPEFETSSSAARAETGTFTSAQAIAELHVESAALREGIAALRREDIGALSNNADTYTSTLAQLITDLRAEVAELLEAVPAPRKIAAKAAIKAEAVKARAQKRKQAGP